MRTYAVELFFDEALEERVYGIWRGLAEAGINSRMISIEGCHPHLSLGVFQGEFDEEALKNMLVEFASRVSRFDVGMESIGTFPTSGTVFLSPIMSKPLLQVHQEFHDAFAGLSQQANPYYVPGKWYPHCTIGIRMDVSDAVRAIEYAYQQFGNGFYGQIAEIGLVEIKRSADGTTPATPKVVSVKLATTN